MQLKILSQFALCAGAAIALAQAAEYAKPNIKPGLWEVTVTPKVSGEMPIPEDQLAKMTPEQRAKVEAMVKGAGSKPRVYKDVPWNWSDQYDLKLQLAGRKALPAEEFLRGQRLDGTRFASA